MLDKLLTKGALKEIFKGERKGIHGSGHWFKVAQLGMSIAMAEGGDPVVALLFGLYHDCRRKHDGHDPKHGARAADLVTNHMYAGRLYISEAQYDNLVYACKYHTSGGVSVDRTISSCWDADRLDLPRVGTQTHAKYLGTDTAIKMAELQIDFYKGDW